LQSTYDFVIAAASQTAAVPTYTHPGPGNKAGARRLTAAYAATWRIAHLGARESPRTGQVGQPWSSDQRCDSLIVWPLKVLDCAPRSGCRSHGGCGSISRFASAPSKAHQFAGCRAAGP